VAPLILMAGSDAFAQKPGVQKEIEKDLEEQLKDRAKKVTEAGKEKEKKKKFDDIAVNIFINYGFAYRDKTWVPVDVVVRNDAFDISGHVELRTYSFGRLQSPTYSMPAESPKGSHKRFRMYCRLDKAEKIEAMLYDGKRKALNFAPWVHVKPIRPQDLLGLILDDEGLDYGFVTTALHRSKKPRGLHREMLGNENLSSLSDHPQCYDPFDIIIMGDIEPERIGMRHRKMLRTYVERGGVLVVCAGDYSKNYRGSWVEELMGVQLGASELVTEEAVMNSVFLGDEREGIRPDRQFAFTELIPTNPGVKCRGAGRIISTLNPVGEGHVVTVAIDAAGHGFQGCAGYLDMWKDLCMIRTERREPNTNAVASMAEEVLPRVTGIKIHPKSAVVTYLTLYFLIAIVGNWLVCSLVLKRRELAWLFLIIFAGGFTGYAMIYGTAGRAKSSEVEQVDILLVHKGGASRNSTQ
ncbi:hypothetical protein ACFL1X_01770, partial [Candidatus Hydrogenedentota bacterium]